MNVLDGRSRTSLTTPNMVKTERNVACQKVRKTDIESVVTHAFDIGHKPTALIAKSLSKGFCFASFLDTETYNWIKQYIAIVTDNDTTRVIYQKNKLNITKFGAAEVYVEVAPS